MSQSTQKCLPTKEQLRAIFKEKAGEDDKLSKSELTEWLGVMGYNVDIIMKDLDKDKNGFIDEAEFLGEVMKNPRMEGLGKLFDEIDTDKSGELSYGEVVKKLQSTELGSIGVEVYAMFYWCTVYRHLRPFSTGTSKYDITDKGGMLQEFDKERLLSEFAKMDPDGDGSITKDEFVNYMNKRY